MRLHYLKLKNKNGKTSAYLPANMFLKCCLREATKQIKNLVKVTAQGKS